MNRNTRSLRSSLHKAYHKSKRTGSAMPADAGAMVGHKPRKSTGPKVARGGRSSDTN